MAYFSAKAPLAKDPEDLGFGRGLHCADNWTDHELTFNQVKTEKDTALNWLMAVNIDYALTSLERKGG